MSDITLTLAAEHPYAHETLEAAEAAALKWAVAQRNGIGEPYGNRMVTRLVKAFRRGVLDQERPCEQSNYDTPITAAYRAGRALRSALIQLSRSSTEAADA